MSVAKIAVLCDHCKAVVVETQAIVVHEFDGKRTVISPQDMLAVEASDKGLYFYMKDGRKVYEIMTLQRILAQYPGLFFRASREWIVANNAVEGYDIDGPGKHTLRLPHGIRVTVSRREWRGVATLLGAKNRRRGLRPLEHMNLMRANVTHSRAGKPLINRESSKNSPKESL